MALDLHFEYTFKSPTEKRFQLDSIGAAKDMEMTYSIYSISRIQHIFMKYLLNL